MRGKVISTRITRVKIRITPAYAGKSATVRHMRAKSRDHPRLCGEKSKGRCCQGLGYGSPPPMRGKEATSEAFFPLVGITPAYAGKSRLKKPQNASS